MFSSVAANKDATDRNLLPRLAIGDTVSENELTDHGDGQYR
jgi:hypothetical protein